MIEDEFEADFEQDYEQASCLSDHLHHNSAGVVFAGFGDGVFDDGFGVVLGEHVGDAVVPDAVDDAVGAEEEAVAALATDGADLGVDALSARAEDLHEDALEKKMPGIM